MQTTQMTDITNELNEAIALAEKLNDILYNLAENIDEDCNLTSQSIMRYLELKEMFDVTRTSNGIHDHLETLSEIIIL